jgi:hypothetical protein
MIISLGLDDDGNRLKFFWRYRSGKLAFDFAPKVANSLDALDCMLCHFPPCRISLALGLLYQR